MTLLEPGHGIPYPGILHVLHKYHILGHEIKIRHQLAPAIFISTKRKLKVLEALEIRETRLSGSESDPLTGNELGG